MSIPHFKAAWECKKFKGNTRLLLLFLADASSNGTSVTKRNLPLGYTSKSLLSMMDGINTNRHQTVSLALKELRDAGAIKTIRRKNKTSLTFVDIKWLEAWAYTDEDRAARRATNPELELDSTESAQGYTETAQGATEQNGKQDGANLDKSAQPSKEDNTFRTVQSTQTALSRGKLGAENALSDSAENAQGIRFPRTEGVEDQPASLRDGLPAASQRKTRRQTASQLKPKSKTVGETPTPPSSGRSLTDLVCPKPKAPVQKPEPTSDLCPKCLIDEFDCPCRPVRVASKTPSPTPAAPLPEDETCTVCGKYELDCLGHEKRKAATAASEGHQAFEIEEDLG